MKREFVEQIAYTKRLNFIVIHIYIYSKIKILNPFLGNQLHHVMFLIFFFFLLHVFGMGVIRIIF